MSLTPVAEGVWTSRTPVRILGMKLHANMTVLRLPDGALVLHSPVPATEALVEAVTRLGAVAHLIAPNTFHHMWLGDWAARFPAAKVHAPADLQTEGRVDRRHDREAEPDFAGVLVEVPIRGFRLRETALVHAPTGTLVVADLVHNIGRPEDLWTRMYTQAMGFYDAVALSRMLRWTSFDDRRLARESVDAVLDLPIERLLVGHGAPVTDGARDALALAFSWLGEGRSLALTPTSPPPCG